MLKIIFPKSVAFKKVLISANDRAFQYLNINEGLVNDLLSVSYTFWNEVFSIKNVPEFCKVEISLNKCYNRGETFFNLMDIYIIRLYF